MKIANYPEFKTQVFAVYEKATGLRSLLDMYERDDMAAPAIRDAMLLTLDVLRLRVHDAVRAARGDQPMTGGE